MAKQYWKPEKRDIVWVKAVGIWFGQVGAVENIHGPWVAVRLRMWDPLTKRMKKEKVTPVERWMSVNFHVSEIGPAVLDGLLWVPPFKVKEGKEPLG